MTTPPWTKSLAQRRAARTQRRAARTEWGTLWIPPPPSPPRIRPDPALMISSYREVTRAAMERYKLHVRNYQRHVQELVNQMQSTERTRGAYALSCVQDLIETRKQVEQIYTETRRTLRKQLRGVVSAVLLAWMVPWLFMSTQIALEVFVTVLSVASVYLLWLLGVAFEDGSRAHLFAAQHHLKWMLADPAYWTDGVLRLRTRVELQRAERVLQLTAFHWRTRLQLLAWRNPMEAKPDAST